MMAIPDKTSASQMSVLDSTLMGVMGGGGTTPDFLLSLMHLQAQRRFPLEKLVRRYAFADVNQAIDDSDEGVCVKPVLIMP